MAGSWASRGKDARDLRQGRALREHFCSKLSTHHVPNMELSFGDKHESHGLSLRKLRAEWE
jgi:hypothetical protein